MSMVSRRIPLHAIALCAVLTLAACGGEPPVTQAGDVTCEQLIAIARATGANTVFTDVDETGDLPRAGLLNQVLGRRTTARIEVRENAGDPNVITPEALREGVVIGKVSARHADRRLKLRGGDHYWAVAWDTGSTGMSVMVPVAGNQQPECETLYIKDRPEDRPYQARFLSDVRANAALFMRAYVREAEAVWEACGAMCCCAGRASLCETHDLDLTM